MPITIAHRGASAEAPENTLASIQKAIQIPTPFIEFDVQLSKDQVPVIFHDKELTRITQGKIDQQISELTYKELQALDVGSWFGTEFEGEKIPSLKTLLEIVPKEIGLMIELKKYDHSPKIFVSKVLEELYQIKCPIYIGSFSYEIIREVKTQNPNIPTASIVRYLENLEQHLQLQSPLFVLSHKIVTEELVSKLHSLNKIVWTYTVDTSRELEKVIDAKVDGIISNSPRNTISF